MSKRESVTVHWRNLKSGDRIIEWTSPDTLLITRKV